MDISNKENAFSGKAFGKAIKEDKYNSNCIINCRNELTFLAIQIPYGTKLQCNFTLNGRTEKSQIFKAQFSPRV